MFFLEACRRHHAFMIYLLLSLPSTIYSKNAIRGGHNELMNIDHTETSDLRLLSKKSEVLNDVKSVIHDIKEVIDTPVIGDKEHIMEELTKRTKIISLEKSLMSLTSKLITNETTRFEDNGSPSSSSLLFQTSHYQGIPAWTSNNLSLPELSNGVSTSIGGHGGGTRASRWWYRCSSLVNNTSLGVPPSRTPPFDIDGKAALDATGYDRLGFWMHSSYNSSSMVAPRMKLQIVSDNCTNGKYDYYQSNAIDVNWVGWRWMSLSLVVGEPEGWSSLEDVHPFMNMREPLALGRSIQRLVITEVDDGDIPAVDVTLGGAAVYSSLVSEARVIYAGFMEDGSVYVRRHEIKLRTGQPGLAPNITTSVPPGVSMTYSLSPDSQTLTIDLRGHPSTLVESSSSNPQTDDNIRVSLSIPSLNPPAPFPLCELRLSWSRLFSSTSDLATFRDASLSNNPMAYATSSQYNSAITRAADTSASSSSPSWNNQAVSTLLSFATDWPQSYIQKWASVSPNHEWTLPPHGGQNIITYPTLCSDNSKAELNTATSSFTCMTGYPPHECGVGSDKSATLKITNGNAVWTCSDKINTPTPTWNRWPYTHLTYDMRHVELAESAFKLALAYRLGGGDAAGNKAWDILLAYADKYSDYPRIGRDDQPEVQGENSWAMTGAKDSGRVHSQTMEEGLWFYNMARAYDIVKGMAGKESSRELVETGLLRPGAAVLSSFVSIGNHQSYHNLGLATIGLALSDVTLITRAISRPSYGLTYQLLTTGLYCGDVPCVDNSGAWYEGSFVYQMVTLAPLVDLATSLLRIGRNYFGSESSLTKMVSLPLKVMMPDTMLPRVNDALSRWLDNYGFIYELAYAGTCAGENSCDEDAAYVVSLSRDKNPSLTNYNRLLFGTSEVGSTQPSQKNIILDDAGMAVLRRELVTSSNNPQDMLYVHLDFGPHGGYHGHLDKLGIVTYALGRERGADPGTGSYKLANHDGWFRTTLGHNTVVMDEKSQKEGRGKRVAWYTSDIASMVTASATDIYANVSVYERTLVLCPGYLLDLFHVKDNDGASRKWDWSYRDNSGTNVNNKNEKRENGRPVIVQPHNSAITPTIDSSYSLPANMGYNYLKQVKSYTGAPSWELIFNNVASQSYTSFVNQAAGICSYTTPAPLSKNDQSIKWSSVEQDLSSVIKITFDVTATPTVTPFYKARANFVLSAPAQALPESSPPVALSLRYRTERATKVYIQLRVYDNNNVFTILNVGRSYTSSTNWKTFSSTAIKKNFAMPLKYIFVTIFWGGVELVSDIFLGDVSLTFDDGSNVMWSPIVNSPGGGTETGTKLIVAGSSSSMITTTRAVTAMGIDESLSTEIPTTLLRREGVDRTTFSVLHEFWRGSAEATVVESYKEYRATDCSAPTHHVIGVDNGSGEGGWVDWLHASIPADMSPDSCEGKDTTPHFESGIKVQADFAYLRLMKTRTGKETLRYLVVRNAMMVGTIFVISNETTMSTNTRGIDCDVVWEEGGKEVRLTTVRPEDMSSLSSTVSVALEAWGAHTKLYVDDEPQVSFAVEGNTVRFHINLIDTTRRLKNVP